MTLFSMLTVALAAPNPGGPGSNAPDRDWDLEHLHLELDVDLDARRIEGAVTMTVRPLLPGDDWWVLDQIDLEIQAVTADGEPVPYKVEGEALRIQLGRGDGDAREVRISYAASPRKGLHWRGPGPDSPDTYAEVWSQGEGEDNRYWIPLPDYPDDRFTTSGRFTAPEGYAVISNGLAARDGEAWVYEMEQDLVAYLVMLAVGPYELREDAWGEVPIQQWYADADAESVASVSQHVPEMMAFFSERTGLAYPYPIYREVFVQRFMYTGMENTTSTIEDRELLHPAEEREEQVWPERVAAHELAHQWYGDALTCRTWHELWLNEGFATFFASEWGRQAAGDASWASDVKGWYRSSVNAPPVSGRFWSTPSGEHGENSHVYVRGASVLQMLRVMLGEEAFWAGIQRYTTEHAHQLVETDDLRRAFEAVTGQHLRWFFDQWIHLPGAPTVQAAATWEDGALTVRVTQEHDPEGERPLYRAPIDVEIGTDGEPIRARFWLEDAAASWTTELDAPPRYVAIDPDGGVLMDLSVDQALEMWIAQLDTEAPFARLQAIEAIGEARPTDDSVAALVGILQRADEPLSARLAAAGALGRFAGREDAGRALVEALGEDPHRRIRIAAAAALQKEMGDADEARALKAAAQKDPSEWVRQTALRSLAGHDPDAAAKLASQILRSRPDYRANLHSTAAQVLGARGDLGDLDQLIRLADGDQPRDLHHAAAQAAVTLLTREDPKNEDDARRAKARRALEPMLLSADYRTRQRGVALLGALHDDDAIRALEAYRQSETVPELRDAADDAIQKLRSGPPEAPRDDAELMERLQDLEDRMDALESEAAKGAAAPAPDGG